MSSAQGGGMQAQRCARGSKPQGWSQLWSGQAVTCMRMLALSCVALPQEVMSCQG